MEPKLAKANLGRAELDRRRLGTFPKLCFVHSNIERFLVDMFALGISSVTGLTLVALLKATTFTWYFVRYLIGFFRCRLLRVNRFKSGVALVLKNGTGALRKKNLLIVVWLIAYTVDKACTGRNA